MLSEGAAPIPADEVLRLRALRRLQILDTLPEENFDALTRLAQRIFDAPVALLSLIDENRQWFKSRQGTATVETARDLAFCAHAILRSQAMIVPDALADPRFASNPLVTGPPYIRFYAGAPLRTSEGLNVGTLCVIDSKPRPALSDNERAILEELAGLAVEHMERRLKLEQFLSGERALAESERRFEMFMSNHPSLAWIQSPEGTILYMNRRCSDWTGGDQTPLSSGIVAELFDPASSAHLRQQASEALASGRPLTANRRLRTQRGAEAYFACTMVPFEDAEGRTYVGVTALDITSVETAERRYRETAALQTAILNSANYAILYTDRQHIIRLWNKTAAEWFGYADEEVIGKLTPEPLHNPAELRARADARRRAEAVHLAQDFDVFAGPASGDVLHEGEWTYVRKDGSTFPGALSITTVCDEAGEVTGHVGVISNISSRKHAESALRESEARFEAFMSHTPAIAYIKDAEGRMVYINRACERLWQTTLVDWRGKSDFDLWPAEIARRLRGTDIQVIASGELLTTLEQVPMPDGRAGEFLSFKFPFEGADGRKLLGGLSIDISDRRAMEEALRSANVELNVQILRSEEASQMKSRFLAGMSHELRTPLNSIIGFSELLHDGKAGPLNERQQRYAGNVLKSADHLLALINDLLDLAKVEAGRIEFRPEPVSASALLDEIVSAQKPVAAQRKIELSAQVDAEVEQLYLDRGRLKQIINNYLSNALKFTPEGGNVTVRLLPAGPDHVRVEVEDTGIGIKAEDIGRLYQQFQQLEGGLNRKYSGTGLGLALLKQLVELQGGTVGVSSAPGRGSIFHAVMPRSFHPAPTEHGHGG